MRKIKFLILIIVCGLQGCSDYLDVVPDDVATIDHAFKDRITAQKYLATCYSYMPALGNPSNDPGILGSDEWWMIRDPWYETGGRQRCITLREGAQNTNYPLLNFWDGQNYGTGLFKAIRDCNVFLANINKVGPELMDEERGRWIAEVKFLKAYYHYFLIRMYGPIPLQKENLPISVGIEESRVERDSFDDCINYVVSLLNEAIADLPLEIQIRATDLGHITKPAAMALKADVLLTSASPLFNGNPDFVNLSNSVGDKLFNAFDQQKWDLAATACKNALDTAILAGHKFYEFDLYNDISDSTKTLMELRQCVSEKWNSEIVWTMSNLSLSSYFRSAAPYFMKQQAEWVNYDPFMAPTLEIAEAFYTSNGVPMNEDPAFDYTHRYNVADVPDEALYYAKPGYKTMYMNLNREPRFYANIAFDGGVWFGNGRYKEVGTDAADKTSWIFKMKAKEENGKKDNLRHSPTGYWAKKPCHVNSSNTADGNLTVVRSTYPIYRLADLYLMYAEALNESLAAPTPEVYSAIDAVRNRAGLDGVVESWNNHSIYPDKPSSKEGMRDIIRMERTNELAFEGKRFWDIRRWKTAHIHMNKPVKGLNVNGTTTEDFNTIVTIGLQSFTTKEYLWPIRMYDLQVNTKLTQNPEW